MLKGGNETRSGYVRYVQGIQPNVTACTTFINIYSYRYGLNRPRYVHVTLTQTPLKLSFKGSLCYTILIQNVPRSMCTYHRVIYMQTLHAHTNVPLSSARTRTPFHPPPPMLKAFQTCLPQTSRVFCLSIFAAQILAT